MKKNLKFKVKFKNGYCEFLNAESSDHAKQIIKSGLRLDLENERSLQSEIVSVNEIKPIEPNNCESCSG